MNRILLMLPASVAVAACLLLCGCSSNASTTGTDVGGGGPSCQEGDSLICKCDGNKDGIQYCVPGGGDYGPCECPNACDQTTNSCELCYDCALNDTCSGIFDQCASNQACVAMNNCFAAQCNGDYLCFFECAEQHPTGAKDYIALLQCVQCDACEVNCSTSAICGSDCYTQCDLKFPAGVADLRALAECVVCTACPQDCVDYCPGGAVQSCGVLSDCDACANSDCASSTCSTQFAECSSNLDCGSLNNCYGSCPPTGAAEGCFDNGQCDASVESCACADCKQMAICGGCVTDGMCNATDDACTCADCDSDAYCSDPNHCTNDGFCDQYSEGCICDDCAMSVPNCK